MWVVFCWDVRAQVTTIVSENAANDDDNAMSELSKEQLRHTCEVLGERVNEMVDLWDPKAVLPVF